MDSKADTNNRSKGRTITLESSEVNREASERLNFKGRFSLEEGGVRTEAERRMVRPRVWRRRRWGRGKADTNPRPQSDTQMARETIA